MTLPRTPSSSFVTDDCSLQVHCSRWHPCRYGLSATGGGSLLVASLLANSACTTPILHPLQPRRESRSWAPPPASPPLSLSCSRTASSSASPALASLGLSCCRSLCLGQLFTVTPRSLQSSNATSTEKSSLTTPSKVATSGTLTVAPSMALRLAA